MTAGIPREDGTSRTDGGCWTTGELNNMDQFCYEILLLPCDSCLYCVINPITYVLIRANQENLVQQGTAVTQGHQVYLESMVYLGLLGKKVERWVHTCQSHINTDHCHLIWAHVFIAECFSCVFFRGIQVYLGHLGRTVLQDWKGSGGAEELLESW